MTLTNLYFKNNPRISLRFFNVMKLWLFLLLAGQAHGAFAAASCTSAASFLPRLCITVNRTDLEVGDLLELNGWVETCGGGSTNYCNNKLAIISFKNINNQIVAQGAVNAQTGVFTYKKYTDPNDFGSNTIRGYSQFGDASSAIPIFVGPKRTVMETSVSNTIFKIGEALTFNGIIHGYKQKGEVAFNLVTTNNSFDTIFSQPLPDTYSS